MVYGRTCSHAPVDKFLLDNFALYTVKFTGCKLQHKPEITWAARSSHWEPHRTQKSNRIKEIAEDIRAKSWKIRNFQNKIDDKNLNSDTVFLLLKTVRQPNRSTNPNFWVFKKYLKAGYSSRCALENPLDSSSSLVALPKIHQEDSSAKSPAGNVYTVDSTVTVSVFIPSKKIQQKCSLHPAGIGGLMTA